MRQKTVFWIAQGALLLLGSLFFLNAIAVAMASNFNLGVLLVLLLGVMLLCSGAFLKTILCCRYRCLFFVFLGGLALVIMFSSVLLIYGRNDDVRFEEDAIIVLGAGIHGERVSLTLRERLDTAIACYEKNPNAVIVVSGGQGPQEDISEALAMERYLIEHGVPKESIIKEDRSTSTKENFLFSKVLLDERFGNEYSAVFITSDFHIFRAEQIAKSAGYDNITHMHSDTVWYLIVPSCLRECAATLWHWMTGK